MSLGGGDPPKPVPAGDVADKQQAYNTQAGVASQAGSNINQVGPSGSLTYEQSGTGPGGVPLYTATTKLAPEQQRIYDALQKQSGDLITNANYGGADPSAVIGDRTKGLTGDLVKQYTDYVSPFFTQQTSELDAKLRNQGLNPSGSSNPSDPSTWGPYEKAMNQLRQNQGQTVSGYVAQIEPQAYQQASDSYLKPLQIAGAQIGLENPNVVKGTLAPTAGLTINPANYTGAVAQEENVNQQNYATQQAQQNAWINGLFKLGSAGLGLATGGASLPFTSGFGTSGGNSNGYSIGPNGGIVSGPSAYGQ